MVRVRQVKVNVCNDSKSELIKQIIKKIKVKESEIKDITIIKKGRT